MAGSTKLNKDGLNKVWLKVMELIQSLTGNVDRTKGTLQEQIDVKATSEDYGRVKVTNSSAVTDSTGLALAATEKNASINGTLAKQIDALNRNLSYCYNLSNNNMIELTENTDLNDITGAGTYRCSSASISSTLKNCPVNGNFKLIVDMLFSVALTQRIVCISGSTKMYCRVKTNNTWSQWESADDKFVNVTKKYGTLTLGTADTTTYSYIRSLGGSLYLLQIACDVPAIEAWGSTVLYTTTMKPTVNVYFTLVEQNTRETIICEFTTSGEIKAYAYGKAFSGGFSRGSCVTM